MIPSAQVSSLTTGSITLPSARGQFVTAPPTIEYLVVAGGGGGSVTGGGGGGMRTASGFAVTKGTTYTVTIGAGGTESTQIGGFYRGGDSRFGSIYSTGGGNGGVSGGAGGGATSGSPGTGNAGAYTPSEGADGGTVYNQNSNPYKYNCGGGGGGGASGQTGGNAPTSGGGAVGNGGNGTSSSIQGTSTTYSGGGGAGVMNQGGTRTSITSGGAGGTGGAGSNNQAGTANQGGAGGGSSTLTNYSGGSGVVIIRYADSFDALTATTGSPTITTSGGYRIYKWTGSGSVTI